VHEPETPILDEQTLTDVRASVDDDADFVVDLVRTYLADGQVHVADIAAAIASDDADALVRPAHTLKSSSATVGALRLSARARRLETAGRTGSLDEAARADAAGLDSEWEETSEALERWMAG
jgi:HPt (histidine-containing phosphotransfer) domain-containing protein